MPSEIAYNVVGNREDLTDFLTMKPKRKKRATPKSRYRRLEGVLFQVWGPSEPADGTFDFNQLFLVPKAKVAAFGRRLRRPAWSSLHNFLPKYAREIKEIEKAYY